MNRISARISAALTSLKCPGCGKLVQPVQPATQVPPPGEGKRWSFVWRPPSGVVCPECSFPLGRYARRLKWIRLFSAGVALLTIGLLLYVWGLVAEVPAWLRTLQRGTVFAGAAAFLMGMVGLVLGGRSEEAGARS